MTRLSSYYFFLSLILTIVISLFFKQPLKTTLIYAIGTSISAALSCFILVKPLLTLRPADGFARKSFIGVMFAVVATLVFWAIAAVFFLVPELISCMHGQCAVLKQDLETVYFLALLYVLALQLIWLAPLSVVALYGYLGC